MRPRRHRAVSTCQIEILEGRCLFSVVPLVGVLADSYSGTFATTGLNTHFPNPAGVHAAKRVLQLKIATQNDAGALTGTLSVSGLGNFNFTGVHSGNAVKLILSGDGSGEFNATLGQNTTLRGSLFDRVADQSLTGAVTAAPNAAAVTGNASLDFVAGAKGGQHFTPAYLAGDSSRSLQLNNIPAAVFLARRPAFDLNVTSENNQGLITGTVSIAGVGTENFTGIGTGGTVDGVFSGAQVSGVIRGHAANGQLVSGNFVGNVNRTRVAGSIRPAAVVAGSSGGSSTIPVPVTSTLLNTFGTVPTSGSSSLGSGTASPVAPVTSTLGTSTTGSSVLSNGGSGSFSDNPLGGSGLGNSTDTLSTSPGTGLSTSTFTTGITAPVTGSVSNGITSPTVTPISTIGTTSVTGTSSTFGGTSVDTIVP